MAGCWELCGWRSHPIYGLGLEQAHIRRKTDNEEGESQAHNTAGSVTAPSERIQAPHDPFSNQPPATSAMPTPHRRQLRHPSLQCRSSAQKQKTSEHTGGHAKHMAGCEARQLNVDERLISPLWDENVSRSQP
jgi:hypothetical protein